MPKRKSKSADPELSLARSWYVRLIQVIAADITVLRMTRNHFGETERQMMIDGLTEATAWLKRIPTCADFAQWQKDNGKWETVKKGKQ